MRLSCPNCQEQLSLSALLEHDAARDAIMLALQFPAPLGKLLLQYVNLFKPPMRNLSMDRFSSIMEELLPLIQAAQIERNGRIWPAPLAYWQQAIETMLASRDRISTPLKSHGYLFEIIVGLGNKAETKQEKHAEQGRKYGREPVDAPLPPKDAIPAPKKPRSMMTPEAKAMIDKLTGKGKRNGD